MRKIVRIAQKMVHTYNWYLHLSTCAYGEMFNSNMKYPNDWTSLGIAIPLGRLRPFTLSLQRPSLPVTD
jgi:hypothetical protein